MINQQLHGSCITRTILSSFGIDVRPPEIAMGPACFTKVGPPKSPQETLDFGALARPEEFCPLMTNSPHENLMKKTPNLWWKFRQKRMWS